MIEITTAELERLIDLWVFSKRDREIMKLKLIDGFTYEQIAEETDLSVAQTKRIVKKWRTELLKHLK